MLAANQWNLSATRKPGSAVKCLKRVSQVDFKQRKGRLVLMSIEKEVDRKPKVQTDFSPLLQFSA
jgi:hypothetical protein